MLIPASASVSIAELITSVFNDSTPCNTSIPVCKGVVMAERGLSPVLIPPVSPPNRSVTVSKGVLCKLSVKPSIMVFIVEDEDVRLLMSELAVADKVSESCKEPSEESAD